VDYQKVERRVKSLARRFPWLRELLRAYVEVSRVSDGLNVKGVRWSPGLAEAELRKVRLENGFPLVSPEEIVVDMESLTKLSLHIMDVLASTSGIIAELGELVRLGVIDLPLCARHFLMRNERYFEEDLALSDAEIETLYFVLGRALKPQMEKIARSHSSCLKNLFWEKGYCPICGFPPLVGFVEKKDCPGRVPLKVVCALCGTSWDYPGEGCLYCGFGCGGRDELLYLEGRDAFARCCRNCRTYFKFIELDGPPEDVSFSLEDLATIMLDIRASNLGFARRGTFKIQ